MKLIVYVKMYNDTSGAHQHSLDYQTQIWAVTEHGLSLFAASILALKPLYNYISQSWSRLSSSFSGHVISTGKDSNRTSSSSGMSSRQYYNKRSTKNLWSVDTTATTELGSIDVRNDVMIKSEENIEELRHPAYTVDAYNDSQRRLVER